MGKAISRWCLESEKEIVLLIDEVDKASNYYVFMDFLGMLREKYIARQSNEDITFKSVILAGVSDIKRIKTHIAERRILTEEEAKNLSKSNQRGHTSGSLTREVERCVPLHYSNSPWNVAETFKVELDFDINEIESLLYDYLSEHQEVQMDTRAMAEKLYKYTSGYPYQVSKICKLIDEELNKDFSDTGIEEAVKILLDENNTLFDDLIKNTRITRSFIIQYTT